MPLSAWERSSCYNETPFSYKGVPTKEGTLLLLLEFCGGLFSFCRAQRNKSSSPYALFSSSWLVARGNCQFLFLQPLLPIWGFLFPPKTNGWRAFLSAGCGFFYINGRWWFRFLFFHAKNYRRFRLGQGWNLLSCSVDIGCHFSSHE